MFWVGFGLGIVLAGAGGFYAGLSYADSDPELDEKIEQYVTQKINRAVGAAGEDLNSLLQEIREEIRNLRNQGE